MEILPRAIPRLGKWGEVLWSFANGYDRSPVVPMGEESIIKSVGNSITTPRDLENKIYLSVKAVFNPDGDVNQLQLSGKMAGNMKSTGSRIFAALPA